MAAHTPGPWHRCGTQGEFIEAEPLGPDGPVVEVAYCQDGDAATLQANARLIAAAPDLLLVCMDAWADAHSCGGRILPKTGDAMLMAIRKARGEPL